MTDDDLIAFLETKKGLIDGVAITGGEPCLHADLPQLIERIHGAGFRVKLDTNGYHPEMLKKILEQGIVEYVAMDIKNSPEKYALTCGVDEINMELIKQSRDLLMNGKIEYEFRTTVIRELHEKEDFEKIGEFIKGAKHYFLQRFTDRDSVPYGNLSAPTFDEMYKFAEIARRYVPDTKLRGVE